MAKARLSCIISAYNEGPRIGAVLTAIAGHPRIAETIVVDDASTDDTAAVARAFPWVSVITQETNVGKSAAIAAGVRAASQEYLLFLDADLVGLSHQNISDLVEPVLSGETDMTISLRKNAERIYQLMKLDFVSGERAFAKSLLADALDDIAALPPFGFEIWLNQRVLERDLRVSVVAMPEVTHVRKTGKNGYLAGALDELHMIQNMQKTAPFPDLIEQYYRLWQKTRKEGV